MHAPPNLLSVCKASQVFHLGNSHSARYICKIKTLVGGSRVPRPRPSNPDIGSLSPPTLTRCVLPCRTNFRGLSSASLVTTPKRYQWFAEGCFRETLLMLLLTLFMCGQFRFVVCGLIEVLESRNVKTPLRFRPAITKNCADFF